MDFMVDFEADATDQYYQPTQPQKTDVVRWQSSQACAALETLLVESSRIGDRERAGSSHTTSLRVFEPPPTPTPSVSSSKRSRHSALNPSYRNDNSVTPEPSLGEKNITAAFTQLVKQVNSRVDENLHLKRIAHKVSGSKSAVGITARSGRARGIVKKKVQSRAAIPDYALRTGFKKVRVLDPAVSEHVDVKWKGKGKEIDGHWDADAPTNFETDSQSFAMDVDTNSVTEGNSIFPSLPGPSNYSRNDYRSMPPPLPPDSPASQPMIGHVNLRARSTSMASLPFKQAEPSTDSVAHVNPETRPLKKSLSASYTLSPSMANSPTSVTATTSAASSLSRTNSFPSSSRRSSSPFSSSSKPKSNSSASSPPISSPSLKLPLAVHPHQRATSAVPTPPPVVVPAPSQSQPTRPVPPPLGMRRTHTFSLGQTRLPSSQTSNGLPMRQRGFKAPLLVRPPAAEPLDKNLVDKSVSRSTDTSTSTLAGTVGVTTRSSPVLIPVKEEVVPLPTKTTASQFVTTGFRSSLRSSATADTSVAPNSRGGIGSRYGARPPVASSALGNAAKDTRALRLHEHPVNPQYDFKVHEPSIKESEDVLLEDDPNDSSYGDISFDMDALEETMKMYD